MKLVFSKFENLVEQCHHKPMVMYGGDRTLNMTSSIRLQRVCDWKVFKLGENELNRPPGVLYPSFG